MEEEKDITVESNIENLELYSDKYPFRLALRIDKFENEADYKKFIRNCEKLVRGSIEYKLWKDYIKDVLNVNSCMITNENSADCCLEIHHHVPTLYQLLKAVINRRLESNEPFCVFDICTDCIEIHFQNRIGYLALITSMHEKVHSGSLKIPKQLIRGNFQSFLNDFSRYLDDEDLNQIYDKLAVSESNTGWSAGSYPGMEGIK